MLIVEGHILWLVPVVMVLMAASVIALFTRDPADGERSRSLTLSDEERSFLQTMALEARKQRYSDGKKMQRKAARAAEHEAMTSQQSAIN